MATDMLLISRKIHRQQNNGKTYITHQIILVLLMCQEMRRIVTELHLEIACLCFKIKDGKWRGNELSCPNNCISFSNS